MNEVKANKIKGGMRRSFTRLFLYLAIIGLLNFVASFFFSRFDLTSDKRYTLSSATKEMLAKLDDIIYFKIYLEGSLPAGFDKLKTSTKEMLDEMRVYANGNIEYQFINPAENPDKKKQDELAKQLVQKGLMPTYIEVKVEAGTSQQLVFPAMLASYRNQELPIQLFKEQIGVASDLQLNNSIQSLEYEIASTINVIQAGSKAQIAFVEGQGELDSMQVADISHSLRYYYSMNRLKLSRKNIDEINKQKALIVAKPESAFTEQDKFILDQYIMEGGKLLWLMDGVYASMDSLDGTGTAFAQNIPNNAESLLFKYGVRINSNLIMDARAGVIPVPANNTFKLMPWFYFPLLSSSNEHPIVKNINLVKGEFSSDLDTIGTRGIKKTFLLSTSKYTNLQNSPAKIDVRFAYLEPNLKLFNTAFRPVAVLLEGEFESLYKNHALPKIDSLTPARFKDKSIPTKIIVVADGDIIKNAVQQSAQKPYPLGYDIYSRQTYGNKDFIMNAVNYLCDDAGLLEVRSREVKLRMMDRKKINDEKIKWQGINTFLPLLLIIIFGLMQAFVRRRKFSH